MRESGFQYVYGHEVHADACHKARSLLVPLPSLAPDPRQHILGVTPGIRFLGHPSRQRLRVVPCSGNAGEPLSGYSVPSVHLS